MRSCAKSPMVLARPISMRGSPKIWQLPAAGPSASERAALLRSRRRWDCPAPPVQAYHAPYFPGESSMRSSSHAVHLSAENLPFPGILEC